MFRNTRMYEKIHESLSDVTPEADEVHPVKDQILHQGNLHRPRDAILDLLFGFCLVSRYL